MARRLPHSVQWIEIADDINAPHVDFILAFLDAHPEHMPGVTRLEMPPERAGAPKPPDGLGMDVATCKQLILWMMGTHGAALGTDSAAALGLAQHLQQLIEDYQA